MEKKFREKVEKTNFIELQISVLKELSRRKMLSYELQELIEGLGGDYELILPCLKRTEILKVEKVEGGYQWCYSAKPIEKQDEKNNGHDKPLYTFRVSYQGTRKKD